MIEDDYLFSCPYCGEELTVRLDISAGRKQSFIQDCEVCCKPIQIELEMRGEEVLSFSAGPAD